MMGDGDGLVYEDGSFTYPQTVATPCLRMWLPNKGSGIVFVASHNVPRRGNCCAPSVRTSAIIPPMDIL